MSEDPSKAIAAVEAMRPDWQLVGSLMGGTKAMRLAGEQYLPKWPAEESDSYAQRLSLSTLLPAYAETVQNMTGRVFAENIALSDDVPSRIAAIAENIDRQGNNLQVWSQSVFSLGLSHGLCHILVEHPSSTGLRTRADQIALGQRPYAVTIHPEQVIGWKHDGVKLTQFWYMESVTEDSGSFSVDTVEQIRVLVPGAWMTYRKNKARDEWIMHANGLTSLAEIPLATFYTKRTGMMMALPPLLELAHLNVKHWQSQSDQDNILHVARVPMLAISGIDDDAFQLKVGTSSATKLPTGGDMKWVEHTGAAISAGRDSLSDLIEEMRMAGAKLLAKEKQVTKTATQAEEEAATELSPLETMAGQFEDAIDQTLQFFAMYLGESQGGHAQVNGNFDTDYAPETTLPLLLNMAAQGRLSDESLFAEYKRRGVVSDELTWEEEKQRLADQGPALGAMNDGQSNAI